jgi:hypothetical protein
LSGKRAREKASTPKYAGEHFGLKAGTSRLRWSAMENANAPSEKNLEQAASA